ncbi:OmpA family protein [soil metagenome]
MRASHALPLGALLLLLAGCTHNALVLLPSEDGSPGAVAVLDCDEKGGETVIADPNSRTGIGGGCRKARSYSANKAQRALLDALPPPAIRVTLYFREGTTTLTPESLPSLTYLKEQIKPENRPGAEVQVTGYTDTLGSDEDNDSLSQRRAEDVVDVLAAQGIDRTLMTAVGRGERSLRVKTADGVREPANRRVEVIVR